MGSRGRTPLDRPVFVVGCGRSGTTLLYDILCCHPDLGWFSRYTNRWPSLLPLAGLNRLYPAARRRGMEARFVPFPAEGHAVWDRIRPAEVRHVSRPLTAGDVALGERERAEAIISTHLRMQGRRRFVNKNTRNTIRIPYLERLFPDARFVHVVRDPRATVASLLRIDWWPDLAVWCFDDQTPKAWVAAGNRVETMAAELWRHEVQLALRDGRALGPGRYLEVRYESLVADPRRTMQEVLDFAELPPHREFEELFGTFEFRDADHKFRTDLTDRQITEVVRVTRPVAAVIGYALPPS